ncbi:HET-domain-containing protein, partial [Mytilinidion resinicola]
YAALSHCWSDSATVPQTTRETIDEHLDAIPWKTLSKTFQHAVVITRRLGIRYVWIDSLYIIQKNKGDFEHECSMMHFIYARSFITICASDSEDGSGGVFQPRHDTTPYEYAFDKIGCAKKWSQALSGPLSTRGWAFQERHLSPRVIHYTTHQILWECRTCIAAEDKPGFQHRLFTRKPNINSAWQWRIADGTLENVAFSPRGPSNYTIDIKSWYHRWLQAVQNYSGKTLSYKTDKLPAISGLAGFFQAQIPDEHYLAGIWRGDLIRGLCWSPVNAVDAPWPPAIVDSIPSWSWASFNGPVAFPNLETILSDPKTYVCVVDEAETSQHGIYPFGRVTRGSIIIR